MQSTMQHSPLTVAAILRYAVSVHGDRTVTTATGDGYRQATYREVGRQAARLANALRRLGIDGDQRVATFMWNNTEHLEAYVAIPSMGAVLHTLNIRLFPEQIEFVAYEAEDRVIRRAAAAFPPPLDRLVEVRNQARVHLWFEDRFGEAYAPLSDSAEALTRFTTTMFAVGARLDPDGELRIFAPFGLEDLFALRLRPNPTRATRGFARTAEAALARWPELTIVEGA